MMSGAVLGVYMQSPWVMLGATSGLFLVGFAADVNGAKIMQVDTKAGVFCSFRSTSFFFLLLY